MRLLLGALLVWGFSVFGSDNLMNDGSFETPAVTGRTPSTKGGIPGNTGSERQWISLEVRNSGSNSGSDGRIVAGLTNEIARSGTQSFFVQFDHVASLHHEVVLTSNFIPVRSGSNYEVVIWGRTDARDLVNPEGRSAYLKLEVDYFADDANQSVGEPRYAVQPLPGSKEHQAFFKPDSWNFFRVKLAAPEGAALAQLIWTWETGPDEGEINGTMYFDDITMVKDLSIRPPKPLPSRPPQPVVSASPAASPAGSAVESPTPQQDYKANFSQ